MKTRAQIADSLGISYSIANNRPPRAAVDITAALANRAGWYRERARVWDARAGLCRFAGIVSLLAALAGAAALAVGSPGAPLVPGVCSIAGVFLASAAIVAGWTCEELQGRAWKAYRELIPGA